MASGAPSPGGWVRTPTRVPLIPVSSKYDRLLVQEPLNELGGGPRDPAADERLLVLNDASRIAAEGLAERIAARAASPRGVVLGSIACFALMCFAAFRKAESHDASLVARLSEGMFLGGHRGGGGGGAPRGGTRGAAGRARVSAGAQARAPRGGDANRRRRRSTARRGRRRDRRVRTQRLTRRAARRDDGAVGRLVRRLRSARRLRSPSARRPRARTGPFFRLGTHTHTAVGGRDARWRRNWASAYETLRV